MLRVQIVEDYEVSRLGLRLMLERQPGFEVVADSEDGASAIAQYEEHLPDVIVMDIGMPGMDGYDAARMIRQQEGGKNMTLIALTGWGQIADKDRAGQAGFDHHLVKPVDYDQLMKCLQEHA